MKIKKHKYPKMHKKQIHFYTFLIDTFFDNCYINK